MGQYWFTIAMECREKWIGQTGSKLGEWFWDWEVMGLARLLKRPHWADDISCTAQWSRLDHGYLPTTSTGASAPRRAKGILSLPVELVNAVFDNLDDLLDVLNMCLAHKFLGAIGEPLAHKLIAEEYAPWAKQKIICIGNNLLDSDLPAGLERYVAQDIRDLIDHTEDDEHDGDEDDDQLFGTAIDKYGKRGGALWHGVLHMLWPAGALTRADRRKVAQLARKLDVVERKPYASSNVEDSQLVLFNLSKQKYVRQASVQGLHERLVEPEAFPGKAIDLGQVLLSHICWSSDDGCAMAVDSKRLTRGPWAGDHFEVMYAGQSRGRLDSEEWTDVTDDTVAWLEELWRDTWRGT
ncbi:hypothetical protein PsYK624_064420 [Phanerochaete sordida]|uniref:Uncharacterized protein n=1 Tax=Phanerochaete sordida TaxID=48140 RepID=A0A9P3LDG2_9APHY|nr:hypothetical protein PsYK624_064420 [Phanerochaete sordida]